jgi:acyl-CoA synthetase (AMP-forming)/AMP-acid ligase II
MFELSTLISRQARHYPERVAVVFERQRLTYKAFAERVARVGNVLRSLGVRKGDRVATVLPNCLEQLEIYWACPSIGAVLVPMSPLLQEPGLVSLLRDAGAKCVVTNTALLPTVAAAAAQVGLAADRVLVTDGGQDGFGNYAALTAAASTDLAPERCEPGDPYNIMYTSGTTGSPKGIVHTHQVRAMYALLLGQALGIGSRSVVVHSGSIVFNGAFVLMMPIFYGGGRFVLARQFDAEHMIELIERERGTHIGVVPSQITAMLNAPGFDAKRLASLESIMSVGAPLLKTHKDRLNELLPGRLCEIYGLTEGFATFLDRSDAERKAGSVGVPLGFSRMRIVREDGSECAPGEIGEITGRSPTLMTGYFNRTDLTAEVMRDGWLHTGDMGYVDEEGFLYLVDRKKDMIDSGGVKIYPKDVEEVAARHPAVRDVAVFGVPDEKWGETPIAAVVLKAAGSVGADELRDWINERVAARYQRIAAVVLMEDFPRNVAGKTLKRELREPYWTKAGRQI